MLNFVAVVNLDTPSEFLGNAVEGLSVTFATMVIMLCMTLLLSYTWYVRAARAAEVTRDQKGLVSSAAGRGSECEPELELVTNPAYGLSFVTEPSLVSPPLRELTPAMIEAQRQSANEYVLSQTQRRVDVVRRKKKEFQAGGHP